MSEFTLDQKTEISRAFSAGSFADAHETNDLDNTHVEDLPEHERVAFVLGFFSSYSLNEIGSDREIFDECYFSDVGRHIVKDAGYCDDRTDEYAKEETAMAGGV
jgi:hypothetical protein